MQFSHGQRSLPEDGAAGELADILLQRSSVCCHPRAQPLLPRQGQQPSMDAAVEMVCLRCLPDLFGVCVIQVTEVILTFNI